MLMKIKITETGQYNKTIFREYKNVRASLDFMCVSVLHA